jgi:signal transduction histidine kinase
MLDKAQIEQVLINLVKNSIDVLTSQKTNCQHENTREIQLVVGKNTSQQLYIDVVDNGLGVSNEALDMIFVPFFTTKQKGSGIGLSLSKQIMINHGGDLICVSREQGACFRCIFG